MNGLKIGYRLGEHYLLYIDRIMLCLPLRKRVLLLLARPSKA